MLIRERMTEGCEFVAPDATLTDAAKKMQALDSGFLPVGENDKLVGTITDRDIAMRAVADGRDPGTTTVRDCMTTDVIWTYDDVEIAEAAELMHARQIRRLPVISREKRLVGVVSLGDLAMDDDATAEAAHALNGISEPTSAARH